MYRIRVLKEALADIIKIIDYIETQLDNPQSASKLYEEIRSKILLLSEFPKRFEKVVVKKLCYHRASVKKFNIYYCVDDKSQIVTIVRVLYSGRDIKQVAIIN